MIPLPGERPGEWWGAVDTAGAQQAAARAGGYSTEFDLDTYFLHDVPAEVLAAGEPPRDETDRAFGDVCDFAWPDIALHAVAGSDDRFFPSPSSSDSPGNVCTSRQTSSRAAT